MLDSCFSRDAAILSASDIKTGNGKIFLENLNCLGNEMDVETCTFTNWENNLFKIVNYYFQIIKYVNG
jgi:hypothetical protein